MLESHRVHFGFGSHFWSIFGLRVILGSFWVWRSYWVDSGCESHIGPIFCLGVTLGPFWLLGSLLAHFRSGCHFGSFLGLGVTFGPFQVLLSLWVLFGFGVTFGPLWVLCSFLVSGFPRARARERAPKTGFGLGKGLRRALLNPADDERDNLSGLSS